MVVFLLPHKTSTVPQVKASRAAQRAQSPIPYSLSPPPDQPCALQDSPSESMLFKAVGGMMDTLYWPRGHLLPRSSLQAL